MATCDTLHGSRDEHASYTAHVDINDTHPESSMEGDFDAMLSKSLWFSFQQLCFLTFNFGGTLVLWMGCPAS